MADDRRVRIFDTTLRDGEQSPGASMNLAREAARSPAPSAALGVDVIEAGFPIASPGRLRGRPRHRHARSRGPIICGLARCHEPRHRPRLGGRPARRAAPHPRLPRHLRHPPRAQAPHGQGRDHRARRRRREAGQELLRRRRVLPRGRLPHRDRTSSAEVVEAVIDAGATTVNIPDTVGYAMPAPVRPASSAPLTSACPTSTRPSSASTATTTWAWPSPTPWPASRPAPARSNAPSTASANGPATPPSKRSSWPSRSATTIFGVDTGINTERLYPTSRLVCHHHRHRRAAQQGHRRRQRLRPRSRASTRTACSRSDRPTRSCVPRTSASPRPTWCWASTPAGTPSATASSELGFQLTEEQLEPTVRRLQGPGRQEEGDLRRGPRSS